MNVFPRTSTSCIQRSFLLSLVHIGSLRDISKFVFKIVENRLFVMFLFLILTLNSELKYHIDNVFNRKEKKHLKPTLN